MKKLLSEIFRGEYVGGEHPYNPESEVEIACTEANDQEEAFKQKLPQKLLPDFEEYISACEHRNFLVSEQDFISGFQLAIRLIIEGMDIKADTSSGSAS